MTDPRSSLAHTVSRRRDPEAVKREGWHDQGILVVAEADGRLDDIDRGMVRALAAKLYGARGSKAGAP
jgi:hypothetical protein